MSWVVSASTRAFREFPDSIAKSNLNLSQLGPEFVENFRPKSRVQFTNFHVSIFLYFLTSLILRTSLDLQLVCTEFEYLNKSLAVSESFCALILDLSCRRHDVTSSLMQLPRFHVSLMKLVESANLA